MARRGILSSALLHRRPQAFTGALATLVGCGGGGTVGEAPPAASAVKIPVAVETTTAFELGPIEVKRPRSRRLDFGRLELRFDAVRRAEELPPSWFTGLLLCKDGERIISEARSPVGLTGVQNRKVGESRNGRLGFRVPPPPASQRCELGLFLRSKTSTKRLGNWCLDEDADTARACPPGIPRPPPVESATMRVADFKMTASSGSGGDVPLRYQLEYVAGSPVSPENRLSVVASCQTPTGR
ncbi:MAG: hypothetical protein AAF721_33300, partial [Myxococcota bacterium]